MSTRTKHITLIVVSQAGCLAVGLWMQNRYIISSARYAAEKETRAELADHLSNLSDALGVLDAENLSQVAEFAEQLPRWPLSRHSSSQALMVTDARWIPVLVSEPLRSQAGDTTGALRWVQGDGEQEDEDGFLVGRLKTSHEEHVAVVRALPDGQGYLVAFQSVKEVEARANALVGRVPAIGMMTLVWTCAFLGVMVYLIVARLHDELDRERSQSATDALRQTQDLVRTRDAVIFGLAKLAESRDPETGMHLERISVYSTMLASALRRHPEFRRDVTPVFVRLIGISSALHDIGKVSVEDRILRKPGLLTPKERSAMETHAAHGGDCLREIEQRLGGSNFLQMATEIALGHHERWDGLGYPHGLSGSEIPLSARIVSVVDIYDALSTRRPYKDAQPHVECVEILRGYSGTRLDPDLVKVWLTIEPKFQTIAEQFAARERRASSPDPQVGGVDMTPREAERISVGSAYSG